MPEGAEVKRIAEQLSEKVSNKTFKGIKILSGRYLNKSIDGISEFSPNLPIQIDSVNCKGKFIYFKANDWSIWNTLGMTGGWSLKLQDHSRLIFYFQDQEPIYFNDMRNFGTLKFIQGSSELQNKLNELGPDMLAEDITDAEFSSRFQKYPKKTLAELLMNQKLISGVGNYVKAEALYASRLSPHRLWHTLTPSEVTELNKAIKMVLRQSYELGGATIKSYSDFDGKLGSFSKNFLVYNQKTDPNGNLVIKEETLDKRTTHWVPQVQK